MGGSARRGARGGADPSPTRRNNRTWTPLSERRKRLLRGSSMNAQCAGCSCCHHHLSAAAGSTHTTQQQHRRAKRGGRAVGVVVCGLCAVVEQVAAVSTLQLSRKSLSGARRASAGHTSPLSLPFLATGPACSCREAPTLSSCVIPAAPAAEALLCRAHAIAPNHFAAGSAGRAAVCPPSTASAAGVRERSQPAAA
jgi:hypothetical protein